MRRQVQQHLGLCGRSLGATHRGSKRVLLDGEWQHDDHAGAARTERELALQPRSWVGRAARSRWNRRVGVFGAPTGQGHPDADAQYGADACKTL